MASTKVVAKRDFAPFSLGRLPDNAKSRLRAERMAERLQAHLDGTRMTDREGARALGVGNAIRYAATTGTVAIRWDGARAPTVWTVVAAEVDPARARHTVRIDAWARLSRGTRDTIEAEANARRFQALNERSRWFGTHKQRLPYVETTRVNSRALAQPAMRSSEGV